MRFVFSAFSALSQSLPSLASSLDSYGRKPESSRR